MPKKLKWFLGVFACACFAVYTYMYGAYDPMKAFIAAGTICLIVWAYKVIKDLLPPAPPPIQELPQARNSANNHLFVPPAKYK